jgi:hypothetical protein
MFELRAVPVPAGSARSYDADEWRDALVLVERGAIELESLGGTRHHFERGDLLWLMDLPLRALHNQGSEPAVLLAVARRRQGTKTPWEANSVFGFVETDPSAPPSKTSTLPTSQTERRSSSTAPGTTASAVVVVEQMEPVVVLPVAAHGMVNSRFVLPVAGSVPDGPLLRSVTRSASRACS